MKPPGKFVGKTMDDLFSRPGAVMYLFSET